MRIRPVAGSLLVFLAVAAGCKSASEPAGPAGPRPAAAGEQTVEAGCATCIFKMSGVEGCQLAVRIDGKPYLVSGSGIDDHGDAHDAKKGLCNTARTARVAGQVEGQRFVATRFELLP